MDRQRTNRPVVVGVDGSDDAARAVLWGAAEAHRRRLPLRLVAAFPWTIDRAVDQIGPVDRHRDIVLDRTRKALATARDAATSRYPHSWSSAIRSSSAIRTMCWPLRAATRTCWCTGTAA